MEIKNGVCLSEQQRQAVLAEDRHILLLAVPGAGKTTVITARAGHLLGSGVAPEDVMVFTYNRASRQDLEQRWRQFFGNQPAPGIATIHSFCFRLLGEYAALHGSVRPGLVEDISSSGSVISEIYRELTGKFVPEDELSRIENMLSYCVNRRVKPEQLTQQERAENELLPEIAARYTAWKRERGLMDYDDMLLFAYTALQRSKPLRERMIHRYSHVMVDEAQDTSQLQQDIIAQIANGSLFMVGDEDQSIYGFRGAYPQGLMTFFEQYDDGKLLKLEQNYRCTPEIVSCASKLISANKHRYAKAAFTEREAGEEVRLVKNVPQESCYNAIAEQAQELLKSGSVAVLYRNSFSGIGVAAALGELGVQYNASSSRLSYSTDFITRDICNLIRLSLNPGDAKAFRQVYFRLNCGITREAAQEAMEEQRKDILGWLIDHGQADRRSTGRLTFVRRQLAGLNGNNPRNRLERLVEELGYLDTLEKRGPSGYLLGGYVQRLSIIYLLAQQCGDGAELLLRLESAEQFLSGQRGGGVRLSTVHSAKGQEYDHVIIADALEGVFPDTDSVEHGSLGNEERLEEEVRLFYTAMTRARNTLTIYAPASGLGRNLLQSRFLTMAGIVTAPGMSVCPGVDVSHTFFGMGRVIEVDSERGLVTVEFRHYGTKRFVLDSLADPAIFKAFR